MWDELEDFDDEKVQRTRYVPNVHCGLMVSKNQLSILFINLNCFLVALPHCFGYILLNNEMVMCKMLFYTLCVFDTEKETHIGLQPCHAHIHGLIHDGR